MEEKSKDLIAFYVEQIKNLFPEAIIEAASKNEGDVSLKVDMEKLSLLLGEAALPDNETEYRKKYGEHFVFEWFGKRRSIAEAQKRSSGTLLPCVKDSEYWSTTENIYIEGDNLEVLKLLQSSYLDSVKVIYIDPPYNTGKDFVYKDNYKDNLSNYLEQTNAINAVNSESNGRYHTNWLNMMYPRLKLARNLLRSDGVIFISIDDNEVSNLRLICDEIFGEDNFRNMFITRRYDKNLNRQFMANGLNSFNIGFEYILCYAKTNQFLFNPVFKESSEERQANGYWKGFWNDADRPTMRYDILGFTPKTGQWKWKKDTSKKAVENYKVYCSDFSHKMTLEEYWEYTGKKLKFIRRNPSGKGLNMGVENWIAPADGILRNSNWLDILASKNDNATQGLFDFSKNVELIELILETATSDSDIILDFFSGSATTAHAVMQLNAKDYGNRKYICVQLPEVTPEGSVARNAKFNTIPEIAKERIRRAGKKILKDLETKSSFDENVPNLDIGFKVFKLDSSNIKSWDLEFDEFSEQYAEKTLSLEFNKALDILKDGRTELDVLYEVILKLGLQLTIRIDEIEIEGKKVFVVGSGGMVASFAKNLTYTQVGKMLDLKAHSLQAGEFKVVLSDESFASDNDKTNVMQLFKQRGITNFEII